MRTSFKESLPLIGILAVSILAESVLKSCTNASGMKLAQRYAIIDTPLTEAQKHLAANGLKSLKIHPGLKVEAMATEPTLINPTNIEVDEKGRVWVTEAYNYRFEINNNKPRPEGDRILTLEDKDGDGLLETSTTFYQGPDINAPLGICVLSDRVIVSQSPYVWAFFDDNKDGKADRKEIIFQGIEGNQHDHGVHSFTSGPDGKLYFNMGNMGRILKDKNNKPVLDQDGDEIGGKKYKEGMLFRCDIDGTHVECLGYNFRNPFEAVIDSYGTIWQSDNDDDGNASTRLNYVMNYGNFGYKDEITGATWEKDRINLEDAINMRHWHQNDPGVIPNLLPTGAGSPAGMAMYEGILLPQFKNQMIHAEPGHNILRSYPVEKKGAGYTASVVNILSNEKDQWFRPVDVCVAPDGSLIVADWYDPGVGGHRIVDLQRGRIYRIVPEGHKGYKMPVLNYTTPEGATEALQNPNLAVRRIAFAALTGMGDKAIKSLAKLWHSSPDPRMRARALWVLSKSTKAEKYLSEAVKDANSDLRITGIRAARAIDLPIEKYISVLANDIDLQVRRECAIALRHNKDPKAPALWAALAAKNDGTDRWYLEALGIGADQQWDSFFIAYLKSVPDPMSTEGGKDIIWRARTTVALPYLSKLASDAAVPIKSRLRYFRAFDFYTGAEKSKTLISMLDANSDIATTAIVLKLLDTKDAVNSPTVSGAIQRVLKADEGTADYINFIRKYNITTESAKLVRIVVDNGNKGIGLDAARLIFQFNEGQRFGDVIKGNDDAKIRNVLAVLGVVGNTESLAILSDVTLTTTYNKAIRQQAVEMMGKSRIGETRVLEILRSKKLPEDMIAPAVAGLSGTRTKGILDEAKSFLPNASKVAEKKTPKVTLAEILTFKGNAAKGKAIFQRTCFVCHRINKDGFDFGPALSEIGAKLPKDGLFDTIVNPSAGVSFGYETWQLDMKDGSTLVGIISSRTETDIELKYPGGNIQRIKTGDVKQIKQLPGSMMPAGLTDTMKKQEFADLLEFLTTLKKKP